MLPNAPIDDDTGLPIPTIAVATAGGLSVITDNGRVWDMWPTYAGAIESQEIYFTKSNKIAFTHGSNWVYYYPIPYRDTSSTYWNGLDYFIGRFTDTERDWATNGIPINVGANGITNFLEDRAIGHTNGVDIIDINEGGLLGSGMHCGIATDFNTGWQHGNIKRALLASTDDTDISADTLGSTNTIDGTFSTSDGWTANSDWTIASNKATCDGTNSGRFLYPSTDRWDIGTSVAVEVTVTDYTGGNLYVSYSTGGAASGTAMGSDNGGVPFKFVGEVTGNTLIYLRSESFVGSIDNVKIYPAEADRSVFNTGLAVVGTIAKTPVATGAELVSYDSLTSSNYLEQQYNSDLNFGTDDFCMMGWCYNVGNNSSILYRLHNSTTVGVGYIVATSSGGELGYSSYTQGFRSAGRITHYTSDTWNGKENWNMFVCGKKDGNGFMYVNGVLKQTSANANSHTDTTYNPPLRIGNDYAGTGTIGGGKLALIRISSGFPSEEQIKKIYEDEKKLFASNAKCTLYGSSDAVVALAYDDTNNVIHAGTSAGRSDFRGLNRINNTTTAVTTAISASNGLVAEQ